MEFKLIHQSKRSKARVGAIHTPHGVIQTPGFVAVGTNGTLKSLDNRLVEQIGLELMFCNTYHLLLHPGASIIKQAGGLHSFIGRNLPIITDSGGFQVFSLAYGGVASELKSQGTKQSEGSVLKINEEGVLFRSYRDGQKVLLTPETSIEAQKDLGADIIIPFDELPPYHIEEKKLRQSLDRTHRWEKRSLDTHLKNPRGQGIYAVIHGGVDLELRRKSCAFLSALPFDGFAIGGSLGKTKSEMGRMLELTMPYIPEEKPRHLLGIGDLESLESCIPLGLDTFDSAYPTKAARHGTILTASGKYNLSSQKHGSNLGPLEEGCSCPVCTQYSLDYIRHLFKAKEITALTLASAHNLHFMVRYMEDLRTKILNDEI